jgi:hypothetical protein
LAEISNEFRWIIDKTISETGKAESEAKNETAREFIIKGIFD